MKHDVVPFAAGLLFAVGLAVSGMTLPAKVIGFLDLGGAWDPSLAFVMIGAIAVFATAFRLSRRMAKPLVGEGFAALPVGRVDPKLLAGAAIFGIGWGLGGYCPGPAFVAAATGVGQAVAFCGAMLVGFWGTRALDGRIKRAPARASAIG
jgi:uncharacterized membrane protein YedE/YeeE